MHFGRLIEQVGQRLGDTTPRALIKEWINMAQIDIAMMHPWQQLTRFLTFSTVASTATYSLPVEVLKIVGMTQTSSPFNLKPLHISRFDEIDPNPTETGNPEYFIPFDGRGVSLQPTSASVLRFVSSQAVYSTGTVTAVQGSRRITGSGTTFATSHEGQPFKINDDPPDEVYEIERFLTTTTLDLTTVYRLADKATQNYEIGDGFQRVRIVGTVSGNTTEEEITLNGTTNVDSSNSFTAVEALQLSSPAYGRVTVTSNAAAVTNVVIPPRTLRPYFIGVRLHPIPSAVITMNVRAIRRPRSLHFVYDSSDFGPEFDKLLIAQAMVHAYEWKDDTRFRDAIAVRDRYLIELKAMEHPVTAESKMFSHMQTNDQSSRFQSYGANFPYPF